MKHETNARWAALAARFPLSVRDSWSATDEVRPGQLREATWGNHDATVLVLEVDDLNATVVVSPATTEPGVADNDCVVLDGTLSSVSTRIALWPRVRTNFSFAVLCDVVAELDPEAMKSVEHSLSASEAASGSPNAGTSAPFSTAPLLGSGAAIARDELFDSVRFLSEVSPRRQGNQYIQPRSKFPLGLQELISALGVTQSEAMSVIRGKRALTQNQAELVARAAGTSVESVMQALEPLPAELERELLEPRWRATIRNRAYGDDEDRAREELGRSALALAARAKGEGREVWRLKIQAVLATEGA